MSDQRARPRLDIAEIPRDAGRAPADLASSPPGAAPIDAPGSDRAPYSWLPRRGRLFLRERGLRAALRYAWRRYGYGRDRFVVFTAALAGPAPAPEPDPITFGDATPADLAALPALAPRHAMRVRAFLEEGACWLHVARDGDRLVGYRLVTRDFRGHTVLAGVVRLRPDQVYTEHIFVDPAYRSHHVGRRLGLVQNRALATLGFREVVAAISADNVASLRMTLRRGAQPVLFVDAVRRVLYRRRRVSAVMPPEVRALVDEVRRTAS